MRNQLVEYEKPRPLGGLDLPFSEAVQAAVFAVLSTPQVRVLGRALNPVAGMESQGLVELVHDHYDDISYVGFMGSSTVTMLGTSTTIGRFHAMAKLVGAGMTMEITIHIAEAVSSGDDLIVAIGAYPRFSNNKKRPQCIGTHGCD